MNPITRAWLGVLGVWVVVVGAPPSAGATHIYSTRAEQALERLITPQSRCCAITTIYTATGAVSWTWPTSVGAAGSVLTDVGGNGTLTFTALPADAVSSVSGTALEVEVSPTTGAVVVGLPAAVTITTSLTVPTILSATAAPTSLFLQPGGASQEARPVVMGTTTGVPTDATLVAYMRYAGGDANSGLVIQQDVAAADPAQIVYRKSRGGRNALAAVAANDRIGVFVARGYDGAAFQDAAIINFGVDGTPGTGDMPGYVSIGTSADAGVTLVDRLKVGQAGNTDLGPNQVILGAAIDTPDVGLQRSAAGVLKVTNASSGDGSLRAATMRVGANLSFSNATPTISSGFGTGPAIVGNATAFRVTVGTGGDTTGVVAFNTTFATAPACSANNETAAQLVRATATTTQVTLAGTLAEADKLTVTCQGF